MLFLNEYRARSSRTADHLPWAILIAPGVVLNKDGAFQQTLEYRGPDTASTGAEGWLARAPCSTTPCAGWDRAGACTSRRCAAPLRPTRRADFPTR